MIHELISAEQAKKNAANFDLSCEQITNQISQSVCANSMHGKSEITMGFLKKAASTIELNKAMELLRSKGYQTQFIPNQINQDSTFIKVIW
jgi:hypothetical protein